MLQPESLSSLKKRLAEAKARKAAEAEGGEGGEGEEGSGVPIETERIFTQEVRRTSAGSL